MRHFTNKEVELPKVTNSQGDKVDVPLFNYAKQIFGVVQNPEKGEGMNYGAMKKAIEIMDLVEGKEDGELIKLEEEQWEYLCQRLKAAQFMVAHKEILGMVDYVLELEKVDANLFMASGAVEN